MPYSGKNNGGEPTDQPTATPHQQGKNLTKRDFWQIATRVLRHTLQGVLHIERRGHLKRGVVTLAERLKLHTCLDGLEAPGHKVNQYIDRLIRKD